MIAPEATQNCRTSAPVAPMFLQTAFRPLAERQICLDIAYLLLSFPLGLFGFVCMVTMLSVGFGLAVTIVGLPIIVLTLATAKALAVSIGALSDRLLGTGVPRRRISPSRTKGFWRSVRRGLADGRAWRDVSYLLLLFPLGVFNFAVTVSLLGTSIWMLEQPVLVLAHVHTPIGDHLVIDSLPKALLFPIPGLLLGFGSLNALGALASVSKQLTQSMLVRLDYGTLRIATARTLLSGGRMPGEEILQKLRLYNGPNPRFTVMRVYAVLAALEAAGLVHSADEGASVLYSLTREGEEAAAA